MTGLVPCFRWQGLSEPRGRNYFAFCCRYERLERFLPSARMCLRAGQTWKWGPRNEAWVRIYHRDFLTPSALHRRTHGPLWRFDHHTPPMDSPAVCPDGRAATYLARKIGTAAAEVFAGKDPFPVCPNWRLAWIRPTVSLEVQDMFGLAAMALSEDYAVGTSHASLDVTQELARRVYDEHEDLCGIRYESWRDGEECLVLWERAPELEVVRDGDGVCELPLVDPRIWTEVEREYARRSRSLELAGASACFECLKAEEERRATGEESLSPAA